MAVRLYCQWPGILGDREKYLNGPLKMALSYDNAFLIFSSKIFYVGSFNDRIVQEFFHQESSPWSGFKNILRQILDKALFHPLKGDFRQGKKNRKPLIFLGFAVKLLTRIELVTSTLPSANFRTFVPVFVYEKCPYLRKSVAFGYLS